MKHSLRIALALATFILLTSPVLAQVKQDQDSDLLREKIERLEKLDVGSKSPSVQDIYRRTLLRLYIQFSDRLKDDIDSLKAIASTVGATNTESEKDIADQLKKLSTELALLEERTQTLRGDVKANANTYFNPPAGSGDDAERGSRRGPAEAVAPSLNSQIPTSTLAGFLRPGSPLMKTTNIKTAEPSKAGAADAGNATCEKTVTVSGRVSVKNEGFYENTKDLIPANLKPRYQNENKDDVRLKQVDVVVKNADDTKHFSTITDSNGQYQVSVCRPEDYVVSVTVGEFTTREPLAVAATDTVETKDLVLVVRPLGEYSRAIIGLEQAGASAAKSAQKYFVDLTVSTPFWLGDIDPYFGRRGRVWGTVRLTSVPQQITSPVGTFASGFVQQAASVKVNEVAQAIEFLAGVEYRLTNRRLKVFGSFDGTTANKFTLSLVAGGGATTPLNPRDTLEVFKVFPGAPGLPPIPAGKDFVAFVSPDRDRFFRQFYAGLRAQTYYFDYHNPDIPLKRYPATLDITFGQNEAVTGGRVRGGVLRLEGFFPLPYDKLNFINVFGTALMKLSRTKITDPLILEAAPAGTTVPASNVFQLTVPQMNRDYYRVGVGIDLVSFVKQLGVGKSKE